MRAELSGKSVKKSEEVRPGRNGDAFILPILRQVPRLLTQVDRNVHSPTYGSCCRNHWHYRIEDISNSQFQELVLTLALVYTWESPANKFYESRPLLEWISAILRFTLTLQRRSGSFDEVYKGQDSYAATAFVTFTHTEAIRHLRDRLDQRLVDDSLTVFGKSARWLAGTRESLAANQMAGAAAALYNLADLTGQPDYASNAAAIIERVATVQSEEGWFEEYGGADIGYGSLTAAYLALIASRTGNDRAEAMATRSLSFLRWFLHDDGTVGGEYGSRNTEYFIPVAPALLANSNADAAATLGWLVDRLDDGTHEIVTNCLDDRFISRYPAHALVPEAQDQIIQLRTKLARKQYHVAEQYERRGVNHAAAIMYEEVFDQYYDSEYADDALVGAMRTYLAYAKQSVVASQEERLLEAEKNYDRLLQIFPDSPLVKDAEEIYREVQARLAPLTEAS